MPTSALVGRISTWSGDLLLPIAGSVVGGDWPDLTFVLPAKVREAR